MKNALIFDGSIIEWITLNASIVKHGGSEVPGSNLTFYESIKVQG